MTDPKNKRRNALGRGLSALLSDSENTVIDNPSESQSESVGQVSEVAIDRVETNPYQPRTHFDLVALEELSQSIQAQGIIQPITVRKMGGGTFQLISGERRLQASKMAGLKVVPAYVRTADDEQMLEMALIENIQRQDLNPMEIALAYQRLVDELSLRLEDLGDKVGKKRATVNNYLRLLKLPPEIQIGLKEAKLSMGHARALINIENVDDQLAVYRAILEGDLSVRKVEEMVRALAERSNKNPSTKSPNAKDIHVQKLERKLEDKFGSRVIISQNGQGRGELKIGFESTEDLNRILEILEP
jgi:ParB family transcriptional regulator, chromosome partitioning protein